MAPYSTGSKVDAAVYGDKLVKNVEPLSTIVMSQQMCPSHMLMLNAARQRTNMAIPHDIQ